MLDTTTSPIVGDHVHGTCGDNYRNDRGEGSGYAADHLAFESMTTSKDVVASVERHGNRLSDGIHGLDRNLDNVKTSVSGLVTDSSFRALEQFGNAGIRAEKLAAASDVQAERIAAAGVLQAEKLASAAALAAAECCCKLENAIRIDGEKTRDLVSTIERERQAVALVDCKIEVSNLNQDARFRALLAESNGK